MPRGAEISNVERTFVLDALAQGVRVSGRGLTDFRRIELEFGEGYGNVTVRLGKTRYVCLYYVLFLRVVMVVVLVVMMMTMVMMTMAMMFIWGLQRADFLGVCVA